MESRGTLPAPAIGAGEAPEIAALFDRPGPFVSVYLGTDPEVENAAQLSLARWRNVRRDLESAGAPAAALDAIEALVPDAHHTGRTLAVIADGTDVVLSRGELEPVSADRGRWDALPSVGPFLEWQQSSPTHIVVLCDRVGADIAVFVPESAGPNALMSVGDDDSDDPTLRKSKPGGWSQRRYQERAENTWEANAKAVVERLAKLSGLVDPRLVVLAGDVRAVQFVEDNLPPQLAGLVTKVDGARGVDGGLDSLSDEIVRAVSTVVATDTVAILEKFREELGQADRAADGVYATLGALAQARVDTLLVHDDPADERECWFAVDAPLAASDPVELKSQGIDSMEKGRLVDVAIRTAFRTGARVRVVPSTTATDGLGAILRY
ncbi:MAG TPA: Vms1/Ankzf1 family peptidyl-tRNA hydrolase [Acidimicrobiales bacterium]